MSRYSSPQKIVSLKDGQVFVFGSNGQGHHIAGAARLAYDRFGAQWGRGEGLYGQSYAIPTMDGSVEKIRPFVERFISFPSNHPQLEFLVTRIGCGIAGYDDTDIAPLFRDALNLDNVLLPASFIKILEMPDAVVSITRGQSRTLFDILVELDRKCHFNNPGDAFDKLQETIDGKLRGGDETAFSAVRTLWSLASSMDGFDIEELRRRLYDNRCFHNAVESVYYGYAVDKLVRYISFLNSFRRYTSLEDLVADINATISVSGCSENFRDYFFGFGYEPQFTLRRVLESEWRRITDRQGRLDSALLEEFMFGHHEKMVAEYGLGETLKREYGDVGCHNNLKGPRRFGSGPVYILDQTGGAMKACGDGRRGGSRFEFELRFARPLLENDERYRRYDYGWNELYVPVGDPTLPVLDACTGEEMTFTTEVEKAMFIKKLELDNRKDR